MRRKGVHSKKKRRVALFIRRLCICLIPILLIVGGIALVLRLNTNVRKSITIEAGGTKVDPTLFLKDDADADVSFAEGLDAVNLRSPGDYPLVLLYNGKEYKVTLCVTDTVPPVGAPKNATAIKDHGEMVKPIDFIENLIDVTAVTVSYRKEPDFSVPGKQTVTLLLTDEGGNQSMVDSVLTVVEDNDAPVITGVHDLTAYVGGTIAYKTGIYITDNYDPDPALELDATKVNLNNVGEYTVVYSATDRSGNRSERTAKVTVREKPSGYVDEDTVRAEATKLLSEFITPDMNLRQKVEAIYRYVQSHYWYYDYSDKSDWVQAAHVMMTNRRGDCFNYFALTKMMFEQLGIDNIDVKKVRNYPTDADHYWSLVSLDGGKTWYHFDATPRTGLGDDFCLVTDEFLDAYSVKHKNCHNRDKSLYPATPEA